MAIELEAKIRVENFTDLRRRLRLASARRLGVRLEQNIFFDDESANLRRNDCGLRLRQMRSGGKGPMTCVLTYKGPRQPGRLKRREELELPLSDATAAAAILNRLGYRRAMMFEKRRESWLIRHCRIELDEVKGLGRFVEVEGPNAKAIGLVLKKLSLDRSELIRQSYPQLLEARGALV